MIANSFLLMWWFMQQQQSQQLYRRRAYEDLPPAQSEHTDDSNAGCAIAFVVLTTIAAILAIIGLVAW